MSSEVGVRRPNRMVNLIKTQGLLLLLVVLCVILSFVSPYFLSGNNLYNIGLTAAALGVMAVTQTMLIVSGGLDISTGAVVGLTCIGVIVLTNAGMNVWLAAVVMIVVGALVGAVNGFIVIVLGINPLITTLGTMSVFSGLALMIGTTATFNNRDPGFFFLGNGAVAFLPVPLLIFALLAIVGIIIERRTTIGRSIYAIGGNESAARYAGMPTRLIPFLLYVASGASAALAGILIVAQLGSTSASTGESFTLSVVTAVILGGASLSGGRGSILGTLLAVFLLGVLQNGFTLLLVSSYVQTLIMGVALIAAVLIDQLSSKLGKRGVA